MDSELISLIKEQTSTNKEIILKLGILLDKFEIIQDKLGIIHDDFKETLKRYDIFNERMIRIEVLLGLACGIGIVIAISLIKIGFF